MKERTLLLEMIASRICHDLISPVGAIHNGIEVLDEMGADSLDDVFDLMRHSALQATTKLKAFRLAYGAGGRDESIKADDVYTVMDDLLKLDDKISQEWDPQGNITQITHIGFHKVLVGTFLLAIETLPKGGILRLETDKNRVEVIASGEDFLLRESVINALSGSTPIKDICPRLVTAYLLGLNARDLGMEITIEPSDEQITFVIHTQA